MKTRLYMVAAPLFAAMALGISVATGVAVNDGFVHTEEQRDESLPKLIVTDHEMKDVEIAEFAAEQSDSVEQGEVEEEEREIAEEVQEIAEEEQDGVSEPEIVEEPEPETDCEPVNEGKSEEHSSSGQGKLTKSGGVNYYNGNKETWYSSRVLYHYMTPEWNCGDDGVWRDSDGYVIVASSDLPYGSTIDTSLGMGKVYDSGCASGVVDIYVNW